MCIFSNIDDVLVSVNKSFERIKFSERQGGAKSDLVKYSCNKIVLNFYGLASGIVKLLNGMFSGQGESECLFGMFRMITGEVKVW